MKTSTLEKRIKDLDKLRSQLKSTEASISKDIMKQLKKLMADNPALEAVRWQQYTPHFNDGDTCEFGIVGPYFKFDETILPKDPEDDREDARWVVGGEYGDIDNQFFSERTDILNHKNITALKKAVEEAEALFVRLPDSSLKEMFGDGYQVTVTKDGVETEEYDHD